MALLHLGAFKDFWAHGAQVFTNKNFGAGREHTTSDNPHIQNLGCMGHISGKFHNHVGVRNYDQPLETSDHVTCLSRQDEVGGPAEV